MIHLGDITKIKGDEAPIVDVVFGGSPCQDLSVAGLRKGALHTDKGDGETTRSGLFMEQVRIIKEMREYDRVHNGRTGRFVRPRYNVWENVDGARSSNQGEDFRCVLEEFARIADPTVSIPMCPDKWNTSGLIVAEDGSWSLCWREIDSQYWSTSEWATPQRRKRICLVCDFGGSSAGEILFESESVPRDFGESVKARKGASDDS